MRTASLLVFCITASLVPAQSVPIEPAAGAVLMDGEIRIVYLSPGYTTAVRLPEEISSVAIGNPASFRAEHSESESRLVFLKPLTAEPAQSNALITTKSGQEVSLHLVSAGTAARNVRVDFVLDYQPLRSFLVPAVSSPSLIIASPSSAAPLSPSPPEAAYLDLLAQELEKQKSISSPHWTGKEILIAAGDCVQRQRDTIFAFSVLNTSKLPVDLLGPQIELSGKRKHSKSKAIKVEPIPVSEFRLTLRRLASGQRADGVVVFERPAFKESREELFLRIAQAAAVDRATLLPVPFTSQGETQ